MVALLASLSMSAQQNISFREGKLVSPQVNSDRTVTFRIKAPKAKSVKVLADWEQNNGQGTMKKGKDGVWEYTTPQLTSEMFTYRFDVDGVVSVDPVNPFTRRDVGNVFSIFYVGGGAASAGASLARTDYARALAKLSREKAAFPDMSHETLNSAFPGRSQGMIQVLSTADGQLNRLNQSGLK